MKAVIYQKFGPPEVLTLTEIERPQPAHDEVMVKVHATTVTSGDVRVRSYTVPPAFWLPGKFALGFTKPKKPILGSEFSGIVAAVGSAVTGYKEGDRIFGTTSHALGAYAEYVCVSEHAAMHPMPSSLSFEQAAAVSFGGRTALHFLKRANIQPEQQVLINGASGAVGTYAVQIAKHFGAHVTGVCGPTNQELVRSLGASRTIDYTKEDFTRSEQQYDVIFDAVDKLSFDKCRKVLKDGGYYLDAVIVFPEIVEPWYNLTTNKTVVGGVVAEDPAYMAYLCDLLERGEITPVIDRVYPLEEIVEAHRYVDLGHKVGNVVITLDSK